MSEKSNKVGRVLKQIPFDDLPEQVRLQFDVKTDGDKVVKYSQKDIFEAKKKAVKAKKAMPKSERLKRTKTELAKSSLKNVKENEKIKNIPKYQMLEIN
jgi:hypothetical protein